MPDELHDVTQEAENHRASVDRLAAEQAAKQSDDSTGNDEVDEVYDAD